MSGIIRKMKRIQLKAELKLLKKLTRQCNRKYWYCCHDCGQMFAMRGPYPPSDHRYCDSCWIKRTIGCDDE